MKITNRLGLSKTWVNAVTFQDNYDKAGWRSVTNLIRPVRMALLYERHDHEITEDVSDRIWMLLGSVVHEILAKSADLEDTALIEERFLIDFMGKKISMKPDHVEHIAGSNPIAYHLKDIKLTSVWSVILDDKFDWKAQTNCYAFGLRKIGINVTKISIECLLKDWSHTDAIKDKDYPQDKNLVIPIEVWPDERCEEYLAGRVKLFTECEKLADTMLPPCTMSERWARPTKYKVMKKGAERSTRNLSSMEDAETYIREKDMQSTHEIVVEKGESIRCERYCAAKQFCNQYNTLINPAF